MMFLQCQINIILMVKKTSFIEKHICEADTSIYASKNHCTVPFAKVALRFPMQISLYNNFLPLMYWLQIKYVGWLHKITTDLKIGVTHNTEIFSLRFKISVYGSPTLQVDRKNWKSEPLSALHTSQFFIHSIPNAQSYTMCKGHSIICCRSTASINYFYYFTISKINIFIKINFP